MWWQIRGVTAVFADLKRSTDLSTFGDPRDAAIAYTYFIRAMTVILDRFSAGYIDIQGDGIFGLFSGRGSEFLAAASAITMKTQMERDVAIRFNQDASTERELEAGIGIDHGTLLVRRLGLSGHQLASQDGGGLSSLLLCHRLGAKASALSPRESVQSLAGWLGSVRPTHPGHLQLR